MNFDRILQILHFIVGHVSDPSKWQGSIEDTHEPLTINSIGISPAGIGFEFDPVHDITHLDAVPNPKHPKYASVLVDGKEDPNARLVLSWRWTWSGPIVVLTFRPLSGHRFRFEIHEF